ncbi:MAG: SufD family Fe-S cluster assembly protein [Thermodesulfobacteriota bacterium]|nr:SufD family Fe-S cluster assembly protein [Thermodesulfobacteriota bacterium]
MRNLDERARQAQNRKATLGEDIDLVLYGSKPVQHEYLDELSTLSEPDRNRMILSGMDIEEKGRSGTFIQKDSSVLHARSKEKNVEVIPIKEALEQYDWVKEHYWKLIDVDTDKYTARAHLELHNGYVIRSLPGSKVIYPVQACLYLEKEGLGQNVHNIVIAEEGSELHVITGCATASHLRKGLHVGISEFYVKKNAKLSFTMIHYWAEEMMVRPRSVGRVEEGGLFLSNYISMRPVSSLQMYPVAYLEGRGAVARFYSLLVGSPGSRMDVGSAVHLRASDTRAEIVSRAITNGGEIIARGRMVGELPGIKAHLECKGLILNGGSIDAIPELEGKADGVEMSHEAAVGKIAQEEILYLMSRGLSEDEATSTIVRGFLNVDIPGLPPQLKAEIDRAVEQSNKDVL